jgi:hypothetical protein
MRGELPISALCTTRRPLAVVAVVATLLIAACGAEDDHRPAVWEYLSPVIFQPNCASVSCHSRAAAAAGLDFSDPARGYTSLTGLWVWIVDPDGTEEGNCRIDVQGVVCQRAFRPLVTPFNPGQSRLMHMLRARGAKRMPPDRPLPEADLRLVERWILAGAQGLAQSPAPVVDASSAPEGGGQ